MHDVQNLFSSCPSAASASILDIASYGGNLHLHFPFHLIFFIFVFICNYYVPLFMQSSSNEQYLVKPVEKCLPVIRNIDVQE